MQRIWIQKVSENMAEATVGTWFAAEGDAVKAGDLIVELITEKAVFELEADEDGTLLKTFAESKSVLPVGYTVALIGNRDEKIPESYALDNDKLLQASAQEVSNANISTSIRKKKKNRVKATPAARRLAAEHKLDLAVIRDQLHIDGIVAEKDVRKWLEKEAP